MYKPPFEVTPKIIELVSTISDQISGLESLQNDSQNIKLRKENRIQTIHSSLAIENNTLSVEQVTEIINGNRVLGNSNEIKEVKNSIKVYDQLLSLNPYKEKDLKKAHKIMMQGLVNKSGKYRAGNVAFLMANRYS